MNKYLIIFYLLLSLTGYSQEYKRYKEELIVLTNASNYIVGEEINISIRCKGNIANGNCLSRVAYVELINDAGERVLRHFIVLNESGNEGRIFIPSSLKTGNYQFAAYTKWMLNNSNPKIFELTVAIVNPFKSFGLDQNDASAKTQMDEPAIIATFPTQQKCLLRLDTLFKKFDRKEQATVGIRLRSQVNVKTRDGINKEQGSFKLNYVPDFRGITIEGKSTTAYDTIGVFDSESRYLDLNLSNGVGKWIAVLDPNETDELRYQSLSNSKLALTYPDITSFVTIPERISLNSIHKEEIRKRSKYVQIANAYKDDRKKKVNQRQPIYNQAYQSYDLSQYNDFSSIDELFREIIEGVKFRNSGGVTSVSVADEHMEFMKLKPLILINSIPIKDVEELTQVHPAQISHIEVVRNVFAINGIFHGGIVNLYGNDLDNLILKGERLALHKRIRHEPFNIEQPNQNIPDFRTQLYWGTTKESNTIEFFTSQVKGIFELSISGIDLSGKPLRISRYFEVR